MKTVHELNQKWWYRLLKVIYGGFFLLVAIGSAYTVYDINKSYDARDWKITCLYGNHSTFKAHADKSISISEYDTDRAVPASMDAAIKDACGITQADVDASVADAAAKTAQTRTENNCGGGGNTTALRGFLCGAVFSPITYKMETAWIPVPTPMKVFGFVVLDLLIVLAVAEVGRRAFYYIMLGSVRPRKTAD